jgi:hypothetical protein
MRRDRAQQSGRGYIPADATSRPPGQPAHPVQPGRPSEPARPAPAPRDLAGEWAFTGQCRSQQAEVKLSLYDDGQGRWSGNIYYWTVESGVATHIITNWRAKGAWDGNRLVLTPTYVADETFFRERYGRDYGRYDIVFEVGSGGWVGRVEDPQCPGSFHRPGPPVTVATNGRAVSADAWIGKSPRLRVGAQDFFEYAGISPTMLTASERASATTWTPVRKVTFAVDAAFMRVEVGAYLVTACISGPCNSATGRTFLVYPGAGKRMQFASPTGPGKSQVCTFTTRWECWRVNRSIPANLTPDRLAQWISDADQSEAMAWDRTHPGGPGACESVSVRDGPSRDDAHREQRCAPTTPDRRPSVPRL